MTIEAFDSRQRDEILEAYRGAGVRYEAARQAGDREAARAARAEVEAARERYFSGLPRVPMAVCPVCTKALYRTFDPFGFDGLWWEKSAQPEEPASCPHFCLLRGAVNFKGRAPRAGRFEVRPGPEWPYVIPRILEIEGMVMVVGTLEMSCGYQAFPLVYFAARRPPESELTAGWARSVHHYRSTTGEGAWGMPNDPWDFQLSTWTERGKLLWTRPGTHNLELADPSAGGEPWSGLTGRQEDVAIIGDQVQPIGTPDGRPYFPLD